MVAYIGDHVIHGAMFARIASSALCALVFAPLAACAEADPGDDAVESSDDELNAAGRVLIGSYRGDSSPIYGIVLTDEKVGQQNRFFADVDTGIRCFRAPCPSEERIEGTFSAGSKTITLRSTTASSRVSKVLGQYRYTKQGDTLTLVKKNLTVSLTAASTYCHEVTDCGRQSYIHPMCVGEKTCSADRTCGFRCGPPTPPAPVSCYSSDDCLTAEHCSTEDGVCNASGMIQVCSGTCVPDAP